MIDSPTAQEQISETQIPLAVDLDGTLIPGDMFQESFCALLRTAPWMVLPFLFWLLRGRAYAKRRILRYTAPNLDCIPFYPEVVEYLHEQKRLGRTLVLATASDIQIAEKIAARFGDLFSQVVASTGEINITGSNKAGALQKLFPQGFDYAGNTDIDFKVWKVARRAVVVSRSASFIAKARSRLSNPIILQQPGDSWRAVVRALRPHQWVKNLLIFVPLVMAHQIFNPTKVIAVLGAFAAFSLCASAVYILNDLVDLDSDRAHPRKCRRPFASGELSLATGLILAPALFAIALFYAALVADNFVSVLLAYVLLTTAYSLHLKRIALVDILVLAALYTLRIFAGGVVAEVQVSQWLMIFSIFIFFSLAAVKRVVELAQLRETNVSKVAGRGYSAADLEQISQFGSTSGFMAVLVLALYVSGREVSQLYSHPEYIWLVCPLLLYWITRVWLLAHRGVLHDDPIVFALSDRASYLVGVLAAVIFIIAK